MKKIKRLNQLKNDNILNLNYVVVDLITYNDLIYKSIKAADTRNRMYNIIYDSNLTKVNKYNKLRDILIGQ